MRINDKIRYIEPGWLAVLYNRFDDDVRSLFETESIWNPCRHCPEGYCCEHEVIPVMQLEWSNIIYHVKSNLSDPEKHVIRANIERRVLACPFLVENRCMIYPVRPWVCRIFPYVISFRKFALKAKGGEYFPPFCPSFESFFGTKTQQIQHCSISIVERKSHSKLIKLEIDSIPSFWVIDITEYQDEYERNMPKTKDGLLIGKDMSKWISSIIFLRDNGAISQERYLELFGLD